MELRLESIFPFYVIWSDKLNLKYSYFSPETDSGSESLKLSCQPLISLSTGMPEASTNAETLSSLTSSFKDKMKMDKVRSVGGSSTHSVKQAQDLDQKKVTVQVGDRYKGTGQSSRRRLQAANLDITRAFQTCREEGTTRLDLSKSNISNIPTSVKDLTHLTELYLYSNRW